VVSPTTEKARRCIYEVRTKGTKSSPSNAEQKFLQAVNLLKLCKMPTGEAKIDGTAVVSPITTHEQEYMWHWVKVNGK